MISRQMILYCHVARSGQDVVIDHLMPTSLFVYECTCNSVNGGTVQFIPFFSTVKVAVYSEKDIEKKLNRDMNDYNIYLCAVCRYPIRNASW